ncbi:MAG TPA: alcohol dehydrogenase catalytic domain-containing protein [Thermoleophilaceae bacterium]|jgi:threonine dehydrogenase-like Zn-dependent dehydrogenase
MPEATVAVRSGADIAVDAPAMFMTAPGRLVTGTVPVPGPAPGEALVRVGVVGLCATDLAMYSGRYGAPSVYPVCFGHEWAGVVEEVGAGTARIRVGDLVTGECSLWCGDCDGCRRDPNLCRNIRKFGITTEGAARAHVCVAERHLHRADPSLTPALVALAEPLAVCLHGIGRAVGRPQDARLETASVLVMGAGTLGLGCLLALRHGWGCPDVDVADTVEARLERARALGGHPRAPSDEGAADGDYADLYASGGYELVCETTGSAAALAQALELVAPGGTILSLGFVERLTFSPRLLTLRAARLVGSIGGSGDFEAALALIRDHALDFGELVTHRFGLWEADRGFAAAADRDAALKVQLDVSP